jgi:uncharacterized protein YodC (DUF2158 family)
MQDSRKPINVGDTVRLIAGGPEMRVAAVRRNASHCTWVEHGTKNFGYFRVSMLTRIPDGQPDDGF